MSRSPTLYEMSLRCFPRVSGDEPFKNTLSFAGVAFSPRERG